jgi:hypothetical protein
MNAKRATAPSLEGQKQLETLRQAVSKALETKRRLGQYAVIWRDAKPVMAGSDAPRAYSAERDRRFR